MRECMVLEGKALEPCLDLEDKEDVKTKLNFMVALTNISCHNGDHMIICKLCSNLILLVSS